MIAWSAPSPSNPASSTRRYAALGLDRSVRPSKAADRAANAQFSIHGNSKSTFTEISYTELLTLPRSGQRKLCQKNVLLHEPLSENDARGSHHHGLAATAACSREAGYIYTTVVVVTSKRLARTTIHFLPEDPSALHCRASRRPTASSAERSRSSSPSGASPRRPRARHTWPSSCKTSLRSPRASGTRRPSRPASCSFKIAMICSSVCLLRFIVRSSPKAELQFNHSIWTNPRGQRQSPPEQLRRRQPIPSRHGTHRLTLR